MSVAQQLTSSAARVIASTNCLLLYSFIQLLTKRWVKFKGTDHIQAIHHHCRNHFWPSVLQETPGNRRSHIFLLKLNTKIWMPRATVEEFCKGSLTTWGSEPSRFAGMPLLAPFWQVTATKRCFVEVQDLNTHPQPHFPLLCQPAFMRDSGKSILIDIPLREGEESCIVPAVSHPAQIIFPS